MSALGGPLESVRTVPPDHVTGRTNLTHRNGHRYYGTECPQDCEKVNIWAAVRLITPRQFLRAARASNAITSIAAELWVTPEIVTAYISSLDPDDWLRMRILVGHELR